VSLLLTLQRASGKRPPMHRCSATGRRTSADVQRTLSRSQPLGPSATLACNLPGKTRSPKGSPGAAVPKRFADLGGSDLFIFQPEWLSRVRPVSWFVLGR
jgi:hypothetical protein